MIDTEALFHDTTPDYVSPAEPEPGEPLKLIFRTAVEDDVVVEVVINGEVRLMSRTRTDELHAWHEISFTAPDHELLYSFRIFEFSSPGQVISYNLRGAGYSTGDDFRFRVIPGFSTPDWAKGAVMYQIFVERFCNGDLGNDVRTGEYEYDHADVVKVDDWNAMPDPIADYKEFYGGDLQGVIDKLPYLNKLGIEAIYLNPIFISPSSHKYDTQDYDHIDPHFGVLRSGDILNEADLKAGDELFSELVKRAHALGIKVILDGVFNHCGSFNKWMDRNRIYYGRNGYAKGAYISADSPYRDYFSFHSENWPDNGDYEGWWDYPSLPKLNYEGSTALENYILSIARKWVSTPYNADGWRLDVAADLGHSESYNHVFWKKFRDAVKEARPDALILAEHYGDAGSWLKGDQWDTVMNYDAFMEPVSFFLTGMEKHSDEFHPELLGNESAFRETMYRVIADNFSYPSLYTAMNQLSNHDHSRFLTRTNHVVGRSSDLTSVSADTGIDKAVMRLGIIIQMTWPGAPTLYYGDEAGLCGFTDPDNRRTYPWGHEDMQMLSFYSELIRIHKKCPELKTGSIVKLPAESPLMAYARFNAKGEACIILINLGNHEMVFDIPVRRIGLKKDTVFTQVIQSGSSGYVTSPIDYRACDGILTRVVGRKSGVIMRHLPGRT